jgi:hypothetical protein
LNQSRTTREQDAGAEELAEILHQAAEELRERPQAEAHCQKFTRPQPVDHGAGGQLRESVGPQKCGEEITHVRDRQSEFLPDQRIGNGQGRPIDVIDDAGNDQHSQRDTLNRFKTWCRVF